MDLILRDCIECGKTLIKRKYESKARYGKKKYCSPDCAYKNMKENQIGWWNRDNSA